MIITTTSSDQFHILNSIMKLHNGSRAFELDVTYGKGGFYKYLPEPQLKLDVMPVGNVVADVRALPLQDASVGSVVFDPPFIHAHGKDSIIGNRFSSYKTQRLLRAMYELALNELARVLKPDGLLVVKCQDCIESSKQYINHVFIYNILNALGMICEDLFILLNPNPLIGWNQHNQQHARKTHSYFWVFRQSYV